MVPLYHETPVLCGKLLVQTRRVGVPENVLIPLALRGAVPRCCNSIFLNLMGIL